MNTLEESKNNILNNIKKNISLFNSFENVYLFGSILCKNKVSNDIDILLIYSKYSSNLISDLNYINTVLTNICNLPIHLTTLSVDEEKETNFLKKLRSNYIKLK